MDKYGILFDAMCWSIISECRFIQVFCKYLNKESDFNDILYIYLVPDIICIASTNKNNML